MTYIGSKDLMLEIPAGNVAGYLSVNKFGRNATSATDTREILWTNGGDPYPFNELTGAYIEYIKENSDVVADRGSDIEVQGLDANWNLVLQTATLNAANSTTAVALGTPLRRVFRMYVKSSVVLSDDVVATNSGDTTDFAVITAGNQQTQMAIYTVPSGYTAYITNYFGSVAQTTNKAPTSCTFDLTTADNANSYAPRMRHEISTGTQGLAAHEFAPYLKVDEIHDIEIASTAFDNPGAVNGGFDLILVPN